MGAHFPGLNLHRYISPQASVWLQFLLATPGRTVGRLAVFRAAPGVASQSVAQYVSA
jgi:hypothetical protein